MPGFSLLSLNSFGIPFYLGYNRVKRLAVELNQIGPTVICLQEIQQNAYLPLLEKGLFNYSSHAFFRNQFAPKGGLFTAVNSSCRVTHQEFLPFLNQGRPVSIGFADWALNKGILLVRIEANDHCFVVLNTHLQANYWGDWRASNLQTLIQYDQVNSLVDLIREQPKDAWVIACGDFNFPRQAPVYEHMVTQGGLTDALVDDHRPTYQPFPIFPAKKKWLTTLDYVLYRVPEGSSFQVKADIVPVVNTSTRQSIRRFLTDHKALTLEIG